MSEPFGSVNFTAAMLAVNGPAAIGQALVYDSTAATWLIATAANRTALGKRAEAIAITPYGGSVIGKVAYRSSGLLPADMSLLGVGSASWVRVKSDGYLERCTPGVGDDLVGKCQTDGRLMLAMNTWDSTNISGGGGGATPGGSDGDIQYRVDASTFGGKSPGAANNILVSDGTNWQVQAGVVVPSGTGVVQVTSGVLNASATAPGSSGNVLTSNGTAWVSAAAPSGFTAGGDLSGSSSSQQVEALTGATSLVTIRSTAPTLQWVTATTSPTLKQADNTTNSATGQALLVQAQNATGTTATGGALTLTSGTGTSAPGSVAIQTGGTARFTIAPTSATLNLATLQYASNVVSPVIRQADDTTNSVTGDVMQINAQNCTGTTTTGGTLDIRSGTGTTTDGNVVLRCGTSTRLLLTPTIAQGDILRSSSGTGPFERFARGSALRHLRVNSGGTDIEWADLVVGDFTGGTNGTFLTWTGGAAAWGNSATFFGVGTGTKASVGAVRMDSTSQVVLARRNSGNTNDITLIDIDGSDNMFIGSDQLTTAAKQVFSCSFYASSSGQVVFGLGASAYITLSGSLIRSGFPRIGNPASNPTMFASDGTGTVALGGFSEPGNTNIAATEYSRRRILITGTGGGSGGPYTLTFPTPGSADAEVEKIVTNATNLTIQVKLSAGTTVNVASGATIQIWIATTGIIQVT